MTEREASKCRRVCTAAIRGKQDPHEANAAETRNDTAGQCELHKARERMIALTRLPCAACKCTWTYAHLRRFDGGAFDCYSNCDHTSSAIRLLSQACGPRERMHLSLATDCTLLHFGNERTSLWRQTAHCYISWLPNIMRAERTSRQSSQGFDARIPKPLKDND